MTRTKLLALAAAPALAIGLASPALAVNAPRTADSQPQTIGANQVKVVDVTCPAGTMALSGGWNVSSANIDVTINRALSATQWEIRFHNEAALPGLVQAYARCMG